MACNTSVSAHVNLDPDAVSWRVDEGSRAPVPPYPIEHLQNLSYGPDIEMGSPCPAGCEHRYTWSRGVLGFHVPSASPRCVRPQVLVCHGGGVVVLPCESASPRRHGRRMIVCKPCAERYGVMVKQVARGPAVLAQPGHLLFMTLTAPGNSPHCMVARKGFKCHGDGITCGHNRQCPCTPKPVDLAEWNGLAAHRWNRFWQEFKRACERRGFHVEYFRAVETQERFALHEHLLITIDRPFMVDNKFRKQMRDLAIRFGYGHEFDLETTVPVGESVAGSRRISAQLVSSYVSKYVAKSASERPLVPWKRWRDPVDQVPEQVVIDEPTGEILEWLPGQPAVAGSARSYRTWTCSRGWGSSLKSVRSARRAWWIENAARAAVIASDLVELPDGDGLCDLHLSPDCADPPG